MNESLLAARFLFRFAVPLQHRDPLWKDGGTSLGESCRLLNLAALDGAREFGDVRAAWSGEGLAFCVEVRGKRQPPWCRDTRLEDSDGLQVWVDTRDTHNIHRATRFCHRFVFLPAGAGRKNASPVAEQMVINRARENAPSVRLQLFRIRSTVEADGYILEAFLPAEALAGFDPEEHPRLGFTYALRDRELGLQTFSAGPDYPFEEDPSVWASLELVRSEGEGR